MEAGTDISFMQLLAVRRLLAAAERADAKRDGRPIKDRSALDDLKEDQVLLSGQAPAGDSAGAAQSIRNVDIRLRDISQALQKATAASQTPRLHAHAETSIVVQRTKTKLHIRYQVLPNVEALVVRDSHMAETDRYRFEFPDGATFRIVDKWSGQSTTIWGDPHIDTSDQEGNSNGEFSDLQGSNSQTTFQLEDGTRVTFSARDRGILEQVDIFQGDRHVHGTGSGGNPGAQEASLFDTAIAMDGASAAASLAKGDTVYAGGDGADWFDASGRMLWGETTGPHVTMRPAATIEMEYSQEIAQFMETAQVDHTA